MRTDYVQTVARWAGIMSVYLWVLFSIAPICAAELDAFFRETEEEMQLWLKEHKLQEYFLHHNVFIDAANRNRSVVPRILLQVPRAYWNTRQQVRSQSKPSLGEHVAAGAVMGWILGGNLYNAAGPLCLERSNGQLARDAECILDTAFGAAFGGMMGAFLGYFYYLKKYNIWESTYAEIVRVEYLERQCNISQGHVLLKLRGLRDVLHAAIEVYNPDLASIEAMD